MTTTFENVLSQAKNLTSDEKAKLIEMLTDKKVALEKKHSLQKDEKVLAELKKIVDEQEKIPIRR